ncbi:hypothetical protein H5410_057383 [Solanum commersonii]|uniref:Uncharacterized protein n=1 Tax=Solanum commersonii TaxID=4109 RepID=A0A9J5WMW3_SOLCO|nr:hypothetical protein H5410_057383 [Solanum commersonii]
MGRSTSCATIEEHHELHIKFLADCDQLMTKININFINFCFLLQCQKWLNLIKILKTMEAEK